MFSVMIFGFVVVMEASDTVDVCTHLLQADVIVIVHLVNDDNLFSTQK